jgi:hypothetical protein
MMEAIRSSESSFLTRATRRHIQEDGILPRQDCLTLLRRILEGGSLRKQALHYVIPGHCKASHLVPDVLNCSHRAPHPIAVWFDGFAPSVAVTSMTCFASNWMIEWLVRLMADGMTDLLTVTGWINRWVDWVWMIDNVTGWLTSGLIEWESGSLICNCRNVHVNDRSLERTTEKISLLE